MRAYSALSTPELRSPVVVVKLVLWFLLAVAALAVVVDLGRGEGGHEALMPAACKWAWLGATE